MLTLFAHGGHSHDMETMSMLDHCMPILIISGIIIALLLGVIAYLLTTWQPKQQNNNKKNKQ